MPTTFVTGDLFKDKSLNGLAHGCNCAGAMGKGIAIQFRARFPEMYSAYKKLCDDKAFDLGDVFAWKTSTVTVFNLGTQKHWRTKAELSAIEAAVRKMVHLAERNGVAKIGLPRIGAGLGGLEWSLVKDTLRKIGEDTSVELKVFEAFEP